MLGVSLQVLQEPIHEHISFKDAFISLLVSFHSNFPRMMKDQLLTDKKKSHAICGFPLFPPSECEFSGNTGAQEEFSLRAGSGPTPRPAPASDAGPAHQSDGSESGELVQTHTDSRNSR